MDKLLYPPVLNMPFAENGDKNIIPNTGPEDSPLASLEEGFKPINGQPISLGGKPPVRQDFNGIFNLLSQFYFSQQMGYFETFRNDVMDAIGGYPKNARLQYVNTSGNIVTLLSTKENNKSNFLVDPTVIGTDWVTSELVVATNQEFNTEPYSNKLVPNVAQVHGIIPVGFIIPFAGARGINIPDFIQCDGRSLLKSSYAQLYSVIGDIYTPIPNEFYFNIPNMSNAMYIAGLNPNEHAGNFVHKAGGTFVGSHRHISGLAIQNPTWASSRLYYGVASMSSYTADSMAGLSADGTCSCYTETVGNSNLANTTLWTKHYQMLHFIKFRGYENIEFRDPPSDVTIVTNSSELANVLVSGTQENNKIYIASGVYTVDAPYNYNRDMTLYGGFTILGGKLMYINGKISVSESTIFDNVKINRTTESSSTLGFENITFKNVNSGGPWRFNKFYTACRFTDSLIGADGESRFIFCKFSIKTEIRGRSFTECDFENCSSPSIFYNNGIGPYEATMRKCRVKNCTFNMFLVNNTYGSPLIVDCSFENISPTTGNAVTLYMSNENNSNITIERSTFKFNNNTILKYVASGERFTINYSTFINTKIQSAIDSRPGSSTMKTCQFFNCISVNNRGITAYATATCVFYNCTSNPTFNNGSFDSNTLINCTSDNMNYPEARANNLYINCVSSVIANAINIKINASEAQEMFPSGIFLDSIGYIESITESQLKRMIESNLKPINSIELVYDVSLRRVPRVDGSIYDILNNQRKAITTCGAFCCDAELNS